LQPRTRIVSVSAFTAARTATAPRGDATRAFGEARAERALRTEEPFARDVNDIAAREAAAHGATIAADVGGACVVTLRAYLDCQLALACRELAIITTPAIPYSTNKIIGQLKGNAIKC